VISSIFCLALSLSGDEIASGIPPVLSCGDSEAAGAAGFGFWMEEMPGVSDWKIRFDFLSGTAIRRIFSCNI
jgi:hypothetical protein